MCRKNSRDRFALMTELAPSGWVKCQWEFLPRKSELFSRSSTTVGPLLRAARRKIG